MHHLKVANLVEILVANGIDVEEDYKLEVNPRLLDDRAKSLLGELYHQLGGEGEAKLLDRMKFDFKIHGFLFVYDDAVHFNRYRAGTFKTSMYEVFTYSWLASYKRLCRTYERDCLKSGMAERVWNGPPIAKKCFGQPSEPGDLGGVGAPGWRLNAYNDAQYDLLTRLHGYKMVRIPMYETIMYGGSLKKIDQLLVQPKEEQHQAIIAWLQRKTI
ncbi:hypothetical protein GCM10007049_26720 [Echinicola pacifica]|uniref:Uncharacterized protein n=1 Tax=Echinicola pacifica TaxID=346377 RepID=A0A918USH4_9BACT|nr:hypothetical protein [Echinicola pacifica]GGZ31996.1 hypothetical protein GCM10007049_26720 [Echinicola pacifica]